LIAAFWKWRIRAGVAALCLLGANLARADPFYLRYDATDAYPEQEGWTRFVHDPEGAENRSLDGGYLTLDTWDSYLIYDVYDVSMPPLNVASSEELRVSWRVEVAQTDYLDWQTDIAVGVTNADGEIAELYLGPTYVAATDGDGETPDHLYTLAPAVQHEYLLQTSTMSNYEVYVDGQFAFSGRFWSHAAIGPNAVGFGDTYYGLRSTSVWDFVEVSITPEPPALVSVGAPWLVTLSVLRRER
jgi:hypothetical protein